MKHLALLILLLVFALPVFAQDADPTVEATPAGDTVTIDKPDTVIVQQPAQQTSTFENVAYVIIAALTILMAVDRATGTIFSRKALEIASKYIDPALAQQMYNTAFEKGLQYNLNRAAQTADKSDDEFWIEQAKSQGFVVTMSIDGSYTLSKPVVG